MESESVDTLIDSENDDTLKTSITSRKRSHEYAIKDTQSPIVQL